MERQFVAMNTFMQRLTEIRPLRSENARRRQYHMAKERLLPLLAPEDRTAANRALVDWFRL